MTSTYTGIVLKRYSPPTKFDTAPQGSICEVTLLTGEKHTYIQKNSDEEDPLWQQID